jgi:hypothetical protein
MITCIVCGCTDTDPCLGGAWCETHNPGTCDGTGPSCVIRAEETCHWIEFAPGVITFNGGGLCSFCAEENQGVMEDIGRGFHAALHEALDRGLLKPDGNEPLVELVSDAEATRFLRARRAGA